MSIVRQPVQHDRSYPPARGPVLLLSCMDLRLLDETLQFMDGDGLTNRYDHVILAGAAYGALGCPGAEYTDEEGCKCTYMHWHKTFKDHLATAYDLHHIKDVYILEHRDCGAYREFLRPVNDGDFDDTQAAEELDCHKRYTDQLEAFIHDWATKKGTKLNVKSFLMDLRGQITLLTSAKQAPKPPSKPAKAAKGAKPVK